MGKLLQNFDAFDLWHIERDDLRAFTEFVVRINYEHHLQTDAPIEDIEACIEKDERIFDENAYFYALKTKNGQIFGTINAHLWDRTSELAMEREFNICINEQLKNRNLNPPEIWYSGRLAIDRKLINANAALKAMQSTFFKLLTTCAFSLVCSDPDNIFISEFDSKLQKTFMKLGVVTEPMSEEKFILGSNALPVLISGAGLKPFVERHRYLLGE